jgi:hypothetical protein
LVKGPFSFVGIFKNLMNQYVFLFLIAEIEEYAMEVLCKVRRTSCNFSNIFSMLVSCWCEPEAQVSIKKVQCTGSEYKFSLKVKMIVVNDSQRIQRT